MCPRSRVCETLNLKEYGIDDGLLSDILGDNLDDNARLSFSESVVPNILALRRPSSARECWEIFLIGVGRADQLANQRDAIFGMA